MGSLLKPCSRAGATMCCELVHFLQTVVFTRGECSLCSVILTNSRPTTKYGQFGPQKLSNMSLNVVASTAFLYVLHRNSYYI